MNSSSRFEKKLQMKDETLPLKIIIATLHFPPDIEHNFDEGNIIVQKKIAIPERSSSLELFEMLARIGSHILLEAVEKIENGINGDSQDITQKTYFSHPDLRSYLDLKQNGFRILRIQHLVSLIKGEIRLFRENLKSKQHSCPK